MTDSPNPAANIAPEKHEFRAEIQQLLNILVHSLYTEREIFIRELVSNASDAINRAQFVMLTDKNVLDPDAEPAIRISADEEAKTLTITDNGVGMNHDEMIENLGTIAHSGASAFLKALQEKGSNNTEIIGQFGVGFYSVFMVADKVEVTSRSYRPEDGAYKWTSDGSSAYTIEPADYPTRGTEIKIFLKEDATEFVDDYRLQQIVKRHSNYVTFPIYVGDEVANAQTALWRRTPREVKPEEYAAFYKQFDFMGGDPLLTVHQVSEGTMQFYSLLFVPNKLDRGLFMQDHDSGPQLFARKVLIQQHAKDLLPEWLRFVVGVVDSEDLPLNISRETVQANQTMKALKKSLTGKLISEMNTLAEKDAEKYMKLWEEFGRLIKEGIVTDLANQQKIAGLLRFHTSTHPDQWVSLDEYVKRMIDSQEEIYYLIGDDETALTRSPHLDAFASRGIEVILLSETIDSFVANALTEVQGKKLHNGADADLQLPDTDKQDDQTSETESISEAAMQPLLERFTNTLKDRIASVRESKLLKNSPARLVSSDSANSAEMERIYRQLGQEYTAPKRILEINPRHPLIGNLSRMQDNALSTLIMENLLDTAMLQEGIHPNPAGIAPRLIELLEAASRNGSTTGSANTPSTAEPSEPGSVESGS